MNDHQIYVASCLFRKACFPLLTSCQEELLSGCENYVISHLMCHLSDPSGSVCSFYDMPMSKPLAFSLCKFILSFSLLYTRVLPAIH